MGSQFTSVLGDNFKEKPLLQRLNFLHLGLLAGTPLLALYGLLTWTWDWRTIAFSVAYYFFSGLGITAGYHRLFAHKCFEATTPLRVLLMLMGSAAVEGSVRWWSRDHRAHHKYVDTPRDPYSASKGFWYAHAGWMLVKQDPKNIGKADISDLNTDPWLRWQHKYYLPIALFMGFVVPTVLCGLGWGDYYGGYFIAGVARLVFVHHSTFCVNSLAHYVGDATYTDSHTARNSVITAFVTCGEGYHNFHHEFPSDYRNGVEHWQYDPTKWFIRVCGFLGLAYALKRFPSNEIDKGMIQMSQKTLNAAKAKLYWGPDPATLSAISKDDFAAKVAAGAQLIIVDGFVLDVSSFAAQHPGGAGYIKSEIGKDSTESFVGAVYKHSNAARNLANTLRVARISNYWS